jgi:hypothetical protein
MSRRCSGRRRRSSSSRSIININNNKNAGTLNGEETEN